LARPAAINQVLEQNLAQAHSHLPAAAEGTDEAIAIRWLKSHFWQYLLYLCFQPIAI